MIIVTGGAGFIGSNIVYALNQRGHDDILVVDNLQNGHKFRNLVDCSFSDYLDKQEFIERIRRGDNFGSIAAVFHQGACSDTTEWDGRYIMANNFAYTRDLFHFCEQASAAFFYASSASVYGGGKVFVEDRRYEAPLNMYGYSKFLFDQYIRTRSADISIQYAGLRYFNVYGPREQHKGKMASVAYKLNSRLLDGDEDLGLFKGSDGYADGEQQRDFVYVGDAVDVNLWLLDNPGKSGIFNLGTGTSRSFNDVANAVIAWHGRGRITYIPFPDELVGRYQSFTQADVSALRAAGYERPFTTLEDGVRAYLDWLNPR